jgi:hypothetical protein
MLHTIFVLSTAVVAGTNVKTPDVNLQVFFALFHEETWLFPFVHAEKANIWRISEK